MLKPVTNEPVIIPPFDYAALPKDAAAVAKRSAETIREQIKRGIETVVAIGSALREAQGQLGHGRWLPWLEAEVGMDARTAQRYIADAEYVKIYVNGKSDTLSHLETTTVHLLAASSTPEGVKSEVARRLVEGEKIPNDLVKRMVTQGRKDAAEERRENAELAQISPRARRARARQKKQQEEDLKARLRELDDEDEKRRQVAARAVAFLAEKLGDEDMKEFRRLYNEAEWEFFARVMRDSA